MSDKVITSVVVLVGMIILAMGFRRIGFLKEDDGKLFSRLVIYITLPALIFHSLSRTEIHWDWGILALIMLGAEIICIILAWVATRALKLAPPQMGAMILTAGFGSSSLLGYALISEVFPGDTLAVTEAAAISELGVGPALFTIGVMIAMYFGENKTDEKARFAAVVQFFKSPIFFAVVGGILWSTLKFPTDTPLLQPLFRMLNILGSANTFCVALTVGLLLNFEGLSSITAIAAIVGFIKLILKPLMMRLPTLFMELSALELQVLVLEAAMPSALLTVVLAYKYGCDGNLASKLAFATAVASAVTIIVMFKILT